MRYSVSDTAEYGDYTGGRESSMLGQGGDETHPGRDSGWQLCHAMDFGKPSWSPQFQRYEKMEAEHPIELVGKKLRA